MAFIKVFIKTYKKYLTRIALIWAACLVLFVLIYMIMLRPQRSIETRLDSELTEKKHMYEFAQKAAKKETQIRLNEQIEQLRKKLSDFVIEFEDSANLTFDISKIASEKKVTSFSVRSKEDRGVMVIPDCNYICENHIDISFIAGFNQFATFLNALERHHPVVFINEFSITRSNQDDSAYQVTLDVAAFIRKPQQSQTADKGSTQVYGMKI